MNCKTIMKKATSYESALLNAALMLSNARNVGRVLIYGVRRGESELKCTIDVSGIGIAQVEYVYLFPIIVPS